MLYESCVYSIVSRGRGVQDYLNLIYVRITSNYPWFTQSEDKKTVPSTFYLTITGQRIKLHLCPYSTYQFRVERAGTDGARELASHRGV